MLRRAGPIENQEGDNTMSPILDDKIEQIRHLVRDLDTHYAEMRQKTRLMGSAAEFFTENRFRHMDRIARKALLLAALMIHRSGQGHTASTASAIHIMTAIYFSRAWDCLRFARGETDVVLTQCDSHKPQAVPGWNGLLYLDGTLSLEQIKAFRTFGGQNAYPTHEDPGIQIPTGSLGLGPAAAAGLASLDEYNFDHGVSQRRGVQISTIGDSEFDEGVIHESIKERVSHGITGWIDIIDYNRQSLDGNLDERLVDRIAGLYESYGIPVIILKYGSRLQALFREPKGGPELRRRLDALSTDDYQALLRQTGGVIRRIMSLKQKEFDEFIRDGVRSLDEFLSGEKPRDQKPNTELGDMFGGMTDHEVKDVFSNLGGHDLPMLIGCIENVKLAGSSAAVIAYTVKGWGIDPLTGDLGGHWRKLSKNQIDDFVDRLGPDIVTAGHEWDRFERVDPAARLMEEIGEARRIEDLNRENTCAAAKERLTGELCSRGVDMLSAFLPDPAEYNSAAPVSTQAYLGMLFGEIARTCSGDPLGPLVDRIVTMAADVAYTAGLKDWINRRGVWGEKAKVDVAHKYHEAFEMNVQTRHSGQHIRLSNVEQFLALMAAAFGKSGELYTERRFPFAFFYDVFLERFAEMFKYAAYWDSAVWYIGTIAGSSASGESGLHHGFLSGVIGRSIPNVVTWEPAFPLEINWILAEEFRRAIRGEDAGRRVRYIRLTGKEIAQDDMLSRLKTRPGFHGKETGEIYDSVRDDALSGGYCLIDRRGGAQYKPGKNVIHIFAGGAAVHEAAKASDTLLREKIFANVYVVTSPDLLIDNPACGLLHRMISPEERRQYVPVLTVTDGHPAYLAGIGNRLAAEGCQPAEKGLGITRFDRSGTEEEIGGYHEIHAAAIADAARELLRIIPLSMPDKSVDFA